MGGMYELVVVVVDHAWVVEERINAWRRYWSAVLVGTVTLHMSRSAR
jgi:hypothetical protein